MKGVGKINGARLGDGFGVGEVHPLINMQGVGLDDTCDEGQEEDEEEQYGFCHKSSIVYLYLC